jgi:hypothetical protein
MLQVSSLPSPSTLTVRRTGEEVGEDIADGGEERSRLEWLQAVKDGDGEMVHDAREDLLMFATTRGKMRSLTCRCQRKKRFSANP